MGRRSRDAFFVPAALLLVLGLVLTSCGGGGGETVADETLRPYTAADAGAVKRPDFPSYVTSKVLDGYEFAVAHPEALKYMPCYCGCGLMGQHTNNLDCFIKGVNTRGELVFSDHAAYCDICLEIARDTKALLKEKKSLSEIRRYVDVVHGDKGPGTKTPMPPQS